MKRTYLTLIALFLTTSGCAFPGNVTDRDEDTGSGGSDSIEEEYCYEHEYNGDSTGLNCFDDWDDYCTSLCSESNYLASQACEWEC